MQDDLTIEGFRLSPQQKHLWLSQQSQDKSYLAQCAILIEGPLLPEPLAQAIQSVAHHHEIVRTTFQRSASMQLPFQIIHDELAIPFAVIDLSHKTATQQTAELEAIWQKQAQQAVHSESDTSRHCTLAKLSTTKHLLFVSQPTMCADVASLDKLTQEICRAYAAHTTGTALPEAEALLQYADISEWFHELLEAEDTAVGREFWRDYWHQLTTTYQVATLAFEDGSTIPSATPHHVPLTIEAELKQQLTAVSQQYNVALSTILLACWQILLQRYTHQSSLLLNVYYDGRKYEELEEALGLFGKHLPFYLQLPTDISFTQWVQAVDTHLQEFSKWQEFFEWEQVTGDAAPASASIYAFDPPVSFNRYQADNLSFMVDRWYMDVGTFVLRLTFVQQKESIQGDLAYDGNRLPPAYVHEMATAYHTLLQEAVRHPTRRVDKLPLVSEAQHHQIVVNRNQTAVSYPHDQCLHTIFEAQAAQMPHQPAIIFQDEVLSYGQLNAQANQLAHYLQQSGIGWEDKVALCLERSVEMVVAILAVFKVGGSYIPIDPTYPPERQAFMMADSKAATLLTQSRFASLFSHYQNHTICLDTSWALIGQQSQKNLNHVFTPNTAAYTIYTSGSTGKPKGVMIEHQAPINLLTALSQIVYADETNSLRASLNAPLAFDASMQQLILLLQGHTLYIIPEEIRTDGPALLAYLAEQQIEVFDCTPSQLRLLLAAGLTDGRYPVPRLVLVAGEAIDEAMWGTLAQAPRTRFFNIYGPTECTVDATATLIESATEQPNIGTPLANYSIYVLDEQCRPVPIGVPGELHIGGKGVARGYWGRPQLTAEKFIPHPFCQQPGARLYRTGDLAYYQPDGSLIFVGRIDDQVKIRGYRIEPGEIAAVLKQHPTITEAVVVVQKDASHLQRLIAYLIPEADMPVPTYTAMQTFAAEHLPQYMLPTAYVMVEAFPLTSNGKIDYQALPAPDLLRPNIKDNYVAPRTPQEKILCQIWSEVLGIERIGIDDNYFRLGGDSIRTLQVSTMAQEHGLAFNLQEAFRYQTVRQLAEALSDTVDTPAVAEVPAPFSLVDAQDRDKIPTGIVDAYPLSRIQAGMVFHSEYSPETAVYHDVISFHLAAPFDVAAMEEALHTLSTRHPVLRTSFNLIDYHNPLQLIHQTASIPLQVDDIRHIPSEIQDSVIADFIETEKMHRFDWQQAPFLRFHIHRRTDTTFQLTLNEQQAIFDGWSIASMLTELFNIYLLLLGKDVPPLAPPPPSLYSQYVAQEIKALERPQVAEFWRQTLQDSTITTIPRWPTAPREQRDAHHVHAVPISLHIAEGLKNLAEQMGIPVKSVLLAAHMQVMRLISGQRDVLTGVVTNARPEVADSDRVLGLFLNTLPFRLKIGDDSWQSLIEKTFETEVEMLPFRHYPLAELQRNYTGHPFFETVFNYTYFHVAQNLQNFAELEVLDVYFFEQINYTLLADFTMEPHTARMSLTLNCNGLSRAQVQAIGIYYSNALTTIAQAPTHPFHTKQILPEGEWQRLLFDWNDTHVAYPQHLCFHQLFEKQVQQTPQRVAAVFADKTITYHALNCQANRMARVLVHHGVGSDTIVALLAERGLDLLTAIIAIFKAGGAYLPLDPNHPKPRIQQLLRQSRASLVLVTDELRPLLLPTHDPQPSHPTILSIDALPQQTEAESNLPPRSLPHNLAYVMFTSGSTGIPKGVMVDNRGMLNHLYAKIEDLNITSADILAQTASQCFDISVWQLLNPLLVGGQVHILPDTIAHHPAHLLEAISEHRITLWETVPAILQLIHETIDTLQPPDLSALRWLITTGEALSSTLAREWFAHYPDIPLMNAYGPTECSDDVTHGPIDAPPPDDVTQIPIGRPIANTQLYILDNGLQLVPTGTVGELYVGGAGVGRGYLYGARQTAVSFIPNPFDNSGTRLYKTGDLARYLANGEVAFLGRVDYQVKIRGLRIELGEIEAILRQHPAVGEAVVMAQETKQGEKQLHAYFTQAAPEADKSKQLREYLKSKLPDYMLPASFHLLEAFPLTANGKIDRNALPQLSDVSEKLEAVFVAPRTPIEEMLAELWTAVLSVEKVGIYDNFFERGGHSLMATQLISRIQQTFAVQLPLRTLFESPTIEAIALNITQSLVAQTDEKEIGELFDEL